MRYIFEPARWLMGRIPLTMKFVLVIVVFLVPLWMSVTSFRDLEQVSIDFSAKERVGLEYTTPAMKVVTLAVLQRSAALNGVAEINPELTAAVDALGVVDARIGGDNDLKTTEIYTTLKNDFAAIKAENEDIVTSPATAYERWNVIVADALAAVSRAGDISNLILDPDLDSYYVMDTVLLRLPALADAIGQLEAQAWLPEGSAACSAPDTVPQTVVVGLCTGAGSIANAGMADDLKRAITNTKDAALEADMKADATAAIEASTVGLNTAVAALQDATGFSDSAKVEKLQVEFRDATAKTIAAIDKYHASSTMVLDRLLVTRIDGFKAKETTVTQQAIPPIVIGLYLFIGFWLAVTRAVKPMVKLLDRVSNGDFSQRAEVTTHDELGRLASSLNEAVDGLAAKTERERAILASVSASSTQLNESSTYLAALSTEMATTAEETATQAQSVAAATEIVTSNVTTVAAGIDEMRASVEEISRGASAASSVASEGVKAASVTSETIFKLHEASGEIGKVTDLISSIAKQTNLLALNATIEAARAGDAGKGFAVVANEVKELATESSKAADDIRQRINAIQTVTVEAVTAIESVGDVIAQINEAQTSIAAAVEEQSATTDEIARSINHVVGGINDISHSIGGVAESASHTASNAHDTQAASGQLAVLSQNLREAQGDSATTPVAPGDGAVWPVPTEVTPRRSVSASERFGAPAETPVDIWHS